MMTKKINKIIIGIIILIIALTITSKKSYAATNGFTYFNNSPRMKIDVESKYPDVAIILTDYNGLDESKIKLSHYDENNKLVELKKTGDLSGKSEIIEVNKANGNAQYQYVISNSLFNKNEAKKFYISMTDNSGNYFNADFKITKKSDEKKYSKNSPTRIKSWSSNGNEVSFISRDLAGTNSLKIYDLNSETPKEAVITEKDLQEVDANITFNLSKFKQVNGRYKIRIYTKDNSKSKITSNRTIEFAVEENVKQLNTNTDKEIVNKNQIAVGVNGGVLIGCKKVSGAKKYVIKVKDYKGKEYTAKIPKNKSGKYSHEYDIYSYTIGNMRYWNIKKMDHNYNAINKWMNKNNKIYQFKIYAYGDSNKKLFESEWLKTMPMNVEKDAPEQDVMLPWATVTKDPDKNSRKYSGRILNDSELKEVIKQNEKNRSANEKTRLFISKITEKDKSVYIKWNNGLNSFRPTQYVLKYKKYYSDNESANSKVEFKSVNLDASNNDYTITNLNNEQEYLVQITAYGMVGNELVCLQAEEIVIPHTKETRYAKLAKIHRGNPYNHGNRFIAEYCSRSEAEAFANYGNNGKKFTSKTNYFIWINMYQMRVYIFTKTKTNEWRLLKDVACGIDGNVGNQATPSGHFTIHAKTWIWVWSIGGGKAISTYNPGSAPTQGGISKWTNYGTETNAIQFCIGFENGKAGATGDAAFGNIFHSQSIGQMGARIVEWQGGRWCTAGCIQMDRPWLKWLYDYSMGSHLYVDYGS